ncbi:MAG: biopolymer transporter ExbD [Candidatus Cloacimonetes bacterium]|nr:biopolymer transporter ExbD [Candidatus Cloacimonadota bacterium]
MNIRRKRKNLGGIPTASMSDVAFLLLVFFLSTTKFDIKKGLGLVLPPASDMAEVQKVKLKEENITKILINKEGEILLKTFDSEELIQMNQLEPKIRKIVSDNPDMVISLKTDRKSKYEYMVMALDRLQAAGAEKISLSTN